MEPKDKIIDIFSKFLPERLSNDIKRFPDLITSYAEKKIVTVLFADIVGFTSLCEKLTPDEIGERLNRYFEDTWKTVKKFGGDIDKFVGDAVLVLFGTPHCYEDDAIRALYCALEMVENGKKHDFQLRVGINTGEVLQVMLGSSERMEFTVVGDVVNTASRIQSMAEPGEILVGEKTFSDTKEFFEFEIKKDVKLKGKSEAITLYRLKSAREINISPSKFPVINRKRELEFLEQHYRTFREDSLPQAVLISGEAGIGKTRLIQEYVIKFMKDFNKEARVIRSLEFRKQIPFWGLRELMKQMLKVKSPEDLGEAVRRESPEIQKIIRFVFGLDLLPEDEKIKYFIFKEALELIESNAPEFIYFSDIQWLDTLTKEFIAFAAKHFHKQIFLILDTRISEDIEGFDPLVLDKLDKKAVDKIISLVSGSSSVPVELSNLVLRYSQGNPYYAIEFTRYLMEKKLLNVMRGKSYLSPRVFNIEVPDSLRKLLESSLDNTTLQERDFLQKASVIGFLVSKEDFINIFEIEEPEFEELTSALSRKGFIIPERSGFTFNSHLLYEVIYNSIFEKNRRDFHLKAAHYLEEQEALPSVIGEHYFKGGDTEKARKYFINSGKIAKHYFSYPEAVYYFDRVMELDPREDEFLDFYTYYSEALFKIGHVEKAVEILGRGLELAKKLRDNNSIAEALINLGNIYMKKGRNSASYLKFKEALTFTDNIKIKCRALINMSTSLIASGKTEEAFELLQKAHALAEDHGLLREKSLINLNLVVLNEIKGNKEEALTKIRETEKIAKREGFYDIFSDIQNEKGLFFMGEGDLKKSKEAFREALDFAKSSGDLERQARVLLNLGYLYGELEGKKEEALSLYMEAEELSKMLKKKSLVWKALENQAELLIKKGYYQKALEKLEEARAIVEDLREEDVYQDILYKLAWTKIRLGMINDAFMLTNFLDKKNHILLLIYIYLDDVEGISSMLNEIEDELWLKLGNIVLTFLNKDFEAFKKLHTRIKPHLLDLPYFLEYMDFQYLVLTGKIREAMKFKDSIDNIYFKTLAEFYLAVYLNEIGEQKMSVKILEDVYKTAQKENFLELEMWSSLLLNKDTEVEEFLDKMFGEERSLLDKFKSSRGYLFKIIKEEI